MPAEKNKQGSGIGEYRANMRGEGVFFRVVNFGWTDRVRFLFFFSKEDIRSKISSFLELVLVILIGIQMSK